MRHEKKKGMEPHILTWYMLETVAQVAGLEVLSEMGGDSEQKRKQNLVRKEEFPVWGRLGKKGTIDRTASFLQS